ncbi:MAG: tRNA lysidine(34) synthetase TilS [Bacillales bacterium]|jgi:tRNA(Ile)-lysidine synthase|nr:tRNA lysidine(34) synthetase TilS [Bacillales bacterium]
MNDKYLIAVSAGPDSMALLNIYYQRKCNIVVAHCNYKKRKESDLEEEYLINFCQERKIPIYVKVLDYFSKGNFQAWAREERYNFFKQVYQENNCNKLLIAHHKDDYLETYLIQKNRNNTVYTYGLAKKTNIFSMNVYRPLLSKTKKQLVTYLEKNNIKYFIDKSNISDDYLRNKIRHNIIEKMSLKEKNKLVKEIKELQKLKNEELKIIKKETQNCLKKDYLIYNKLRQSSMPDKIIFYYLVYLKQLNIPLSKSRLFDILQQLEKDTNTLYFNNYFLQKNNGFIYLRNLNDYHKYSYTLKKLTNFTNDYFSLSDKGPKRAEIYVNEDSFPLTVRSYEDKDVLRLKKGHKKISRFFIDKHIPKHLRDTIPLIFDKYANIISIPQFYQDNVRNKLKTGKYVVQFNLDITNIIHFRKKVKNGNNT